MNEDQFKKMDHNHVLIMILLMLITVILLVHPVQAQYITMANPQGIAERDILVYNSTGQLQGVYNSTSTIPLNGSEDYIFSMKPLQTNPLEDPADWLVNTVFPFVTSQILGIVLILIFIIWWRKG